MTPAHKDSAREASVIFHIFGDDFSLPSGLTRVMERDCYGRASDGAREASDE